MSQEEAFAHLLNHVPAHVRHDGIIDYGKWQYRMKPGGQILQCYERDLILATYNNGEAPLAMAAIALNYQVPSHPFFASRLRTMREQLNQHDPQMETSGWQRAAARGEMVLTVDETSIDFRDNDNNDSIIFYKSQRSDGKRGWKRGNNHLDTSEANRLLEIFTEPYSQRRANSRHCRRRASRISGSKAMTPYSRSRKSPLVLQVCISCRSASRKTAHPFRRTLTKSSPTIDRTEKAAGIFFKNSFFRHHPAVSFPGAAESEYGGIWLGLGHRCRIQSRARSTRASICPTSSCPLKFGCAQKLDMLEQDTPKTRAG